ncbi:MAG: HupE/UreJ family protein [Calditrichaeota bacterium]|nr:HupE/UreJ family protein [Calditrichota bacterium]MCB0291381.1 HupE/UreJ family protein [Calditrichota bacterium]MCB0305227.1 HupE/UreJ family protein [Calditrichota bacterium]MCB9088306.1 HupE/UreJ family protein [Calditrichia bacterium]
MSEFSLYLQLGFQHISDIAGYDHILFIVALCAVYELRQWKHLLILVTAFTIGHSITLAIATMGVVLIPSRIVEFLIPVTIFLTAVFNTMGQRALLPGRRVNLNYFLALFFGLIHGMGFSNYLRALLGEEESILVPLFSFNLGLEIGQLMIVAIILTISYLALNTFRVKLREWTLFISGAAAGIALILMSETKFW